jgi:hypothetical protein
VCCIAFDLYGVLPLSGLGRDSPSRRVEEHKPEPQSKKKHLEATESALAAVLDGLPGVHHHMHEQVLNSSGLTDIPTPLDFACRSCAGVKLIPTCA